MEEYKQHLQNYFIASHPLYFVRSGYVRMFDGYLRYNAEWSYEWGSYADSADIRYASAFRAGGPSQNVFPRTAENRYHAFSLRCSVF